MRVFMWLPVAISIMHLFDSKAQAQDLQLQSLPHPQLQREVSSSPYERLRTAANKNVVKIISGDPDGGSLKTIDDIATVLSRKSEIRVIPVVGRGSGQNVKDLLYLNGIDMAVVQPHVLQHFKSTGELGPDIDKQIAYITTLFTDELHVFAHGGVKGFKDLEGKRVNFGNDGSGTQISMRSIFNALGLNVQEVNTGQADAFEMMKKGQLDATVCTCSGPLSNINTIKKEIKGFKLLSVPYTSDLENQFFPGFISHKDYPDLIPKGQDIDTVAVQNILAVFNWKNKSTERYHRVTRFINYLFDNIKEFQKPPRQPKWWSVNIAARVSSLKRFREAQAWLDRNSRTSAGKDGSQASQQKNINRRRVVKRNTKLVSPPPPPVRPKKLNQPLPEWAQNELEPL